MTEELETVLRLVAEGKLGPEEAAPIVDALTRAASGASPSPAQPPPAAGAGATAQGTSGKGRHLRIRVTERGRQVVNLRVPIGFVDTALQFVPGLGGDHSERIRDSVRTGATGPILDVEDPDGGGVLITIE